MISFSCDFLAAAAFCPPMAAILCTPTTGGLILEKKAPSFLGAFASTVAQTFGKMVQAIPCAFWVAGSVRECLFHKWYFSAFNHNLDAADPLYCQRWYSLNAGRYDLIGKRADKVALSTFVAMLALPIVTAAVKHCAHKWGYTKVEKCADAADKIFSAAIKATNIFVLALGTLSVLANAAACGALASVGLAGFYVVLLTINVAHAAPSMRNAAVSIGNYGMKAARFLCSS